MNEQRLRVAAPTEVTEGKLTAVEVGGIRILLSRVSGKVRAVVNRCPHLGMPMSRGEIVDGVVQCPWHGSRFDICTGRNIEWVNGFVGVSLPSWTHKIIAMGKTPAPLKVLPSEETADDVFVKMPKERA